MIRSLCTYQNSPFVTVHSLLQTLRDAIEVLLREVAVRDGTNVVVSCINWLGSLPCFQQLLKILRLRRDLGRKLLQ